MRRYRLVLRAYPPAYRREHGDELLATAVELHPERWSMREAVGLLAGGLRERAARATGCTRSGVWTNGARTAVALFLIALVAEPIAYLLGARHDVSFDAGWPVLLSPLAAIVVLLVTSRWPAAIVVTVVAGIGTVRDLASPELLPGVRFSSIVFSLVLGGLAWFVALRGDGRPALRPTTALAVIVAALALTAGLPVGTGALLLFMIFGTIIGGLLLAPVDPRPLVVATTLTLLTATALLVGPRGGMRAVVGGLVVLALILPAHLGIKKLTRPAS